MIIDLTHTLSNNLQMYPGDETPALNKQKEFRLDGYTDFRLTTGMHAGTHIDGPMHMTSDEKYISSFPVTSFIGKGCVLNVKNIKIIKWSGAYSDIVKDCDIVLVNTGYGKYFGTERYLQDNPVIDESFAEILIGRKIKMLGIDLMSPDSPPHSIHKMLLAANILIAENLANLDQLENFENFEVTALPLKINSDSSPARIIARKRVPNNA